MKFDWTTALQILGALIISGFVWTQDNQLAVLTLVAMAIVWLIQFASKKWNWQLGKQWLTVILLAISVVFAYIFQPVTLPAFPAYGGDVVSFMAAFLTYAGTVLVLSQKVFALATGLYNVLLSKVLDGLSNTLVMKFSQARTG